MPDLAAKKALVENWKWGFAAHIAPGIGYSVANFIGYSIGQKDLNSTSTSTSTTSTTTVAPLNTSNQTFA